MSAFSILLANTLSAALLIWFIRQRYRVSRSLLEPGIIFAVNLIVLYPVRALVLYAFGDVALPDYPGADDPRNLEQASWFAVLGVLGYAVGYLWIAGNKRLKVLFGGPVAVSNYSYRVCAVFFALSLVGSGYKVATGDYISYLMGEDRNAGLSHIAHLLSMMQWPAFIGVWALLFSGARGSKFQVLFVLVNVVVIPFQFIQGSKTFLSLLMLSGFFAYYWVRRQFPKTFALASFLAVLLFVFPFVHSFREQVNEKYNGIPSISKLDLNFSLGDAGEGLADDGRDGLMVLSARYGGMDHLHGFIDMVPDRMPLKFGKDYVAVIVNLVPRMIWPDKPIFSRGASYGTALGTTTSVTPFPFAEAYWDLGPPGVFVMMAVWGALLAGVLRLVDSLFKKQQVSLMIGLYFLSQIYWISGGESSMPMVISGLPQQAVALVFVYFCIRLVSKSGMRVPRARRLPLISEREVTSLGH